MKEDESVPLWVIFLMPFVAILVGDSCYQARSHVGGDSNGLETKLDKIHRDKWECRWERRAKWIKEKYESKQQV